MPLLVFVNTLLRRQNNWNRFANPEVIFSLIIMNTDFFQSFCCTLKYNWFSNGGDNAKEQPQVYKQFLIWSK